MKKFCFGWLIWLLAVGCGPLEVVTDQGVQEENEVPGDCDPLDDTCWQHEDQDDGIDDGGDTDQDDVDDDTDDQTDDDSDDNTDPDPFDPAIESCFPDHSVDELLAEFGPDRAVPVSHPSQILGAWGDAVYRLDSDLNLDGLENTSPYLNGGVTGTLVIYGNGHTIRNYTGNHGLFQAANLILLDVNFSDLQVDKDPVDIYSDEGGAVADFCVCLAMRNVSARNIQVYQPGGFDSWDVRSVGAIAGRVDRVHLDNVDLENAEARLGHHHDRGYAGAVVGDLVYGGFLRDVRLSQFQVSVDSAYSRTFVGSLFGMVGAGEATSGTYAIWMQNVLVTGGTVSNPASADGAYNLVGGVTGSFSSRATLEGVSVQNVDLVFTPSPMLFAGNPAGGAHLSGLFSQDVSLQVTGNGQSGLPSVAFDNDDI